MPAVPSGPGPQSDQVWEEYLAATRRLDAVRRAAAAAAAEQQAAAQAARGELAYVRDRLGLQQREWPRAGVAIADLAPGRTDPAGGPAAPTGTPAAPTGTPAAPTGGPAAPTGTPAAPTEGPAVGDSPAGVLDALRRTRSMVDEADALVLGRPAGLASLPPPLRNLFVYGPFALVVLVAQLVLLSVAGERPVYLPLCGLVLPAAAFGLGFATVGLVFPAPAGGKVERTPVLGAAVCLLSVVLLCAGIGVLAFTRG